MPQDSANFRLNMDPIGLIRLLSDHGSSAILFNELVRTRNIEMTLLILREVADTKPL